MDIDHTLGLDRCSSLGQIPPLQYLYHDNCGAFVCELLLGRKGSNFGKSRWQLHQTRKMGQKQASQSLSRLGKLNTNIDLTLSFTFGTDGDTKKDEFSEKI